MSFLAAVLASAGEVEMTDLDKNVSELKHKITNLEYEIKNAMEQRYMKFAVVSRDAASLLETAQSYSCQIDDLIFRIDNQTKRDVVNTISDLKMLKSTLQENKYSLNILEQVLTASKSLNCDDQTKLSLTEQIKNLQISNEILTENDNLSKLDVYKPLMREHQRLTNVLHSNCIKIWRKQIEWIEKNDGNQESWFMKLKITGSQEDISNSVLALQHFDSLNTEIKLFADKLIELIVKPIILQNLQVEITKSVTITTMVLNVSNNNDESLTTTIRKLKEVFTFLNSVFNIDNVRIMSYLGSYASHPFLEVFKNKALFNALPVQYNHLENFQKELNEVLEFNTFLNELEFFEESDNELTKYIENIDNLFFDKISQLHYDSARTIIKKDLHDLVEVNNDNRWASDEEVSGANDFCQKFFAYPQSKVSKSLIEFLNLIDSLVADISNAPESNIWRYHNILNSIIIIYCDMVQYQHFKTPEFQPQQSAILYNNIMYLTRKLAEMHPTYKNLNIIHLLEQLKNFACVILHSQCRQHITQIEKIIHQSDLVSMAVNSNLGYSVEKSVSQCYNNLSTLSSLWKDILPPTVYCKFMGYSCNGLFECIVSKLFTLEDISATSAEQYSSIFKKIINDIPTLFPEPQEVHRYVLKWWQLNELVYILSSSMKDIENRWADGKGPLSSELKVEQIKGLLKALFQNTDRRAALLKHISTTAKSL